MSLVVCSLFAVRCCCAVDYCLLLGAVECCLLSRVVGCVVCCSLVVAVLGCVC